MLHQRTWPMATFGQRSQRGRIRPLSGGGGAAFGSGRAGEFLRDLRAGSDSVDFVTIGDSNAGYNGGWNIGIIDAMRALGIVMYSTPLWPSSATQATGSWSNTGNGDGYGGAYITYVVPTAVGAGTDADMRSLYDEADSDADADEVADFGVMHENASATVYPYGENYFNGGFVRSGGTFTGTAGRYVHLSQPVVASGDSRTFLQASTNYRYRVVHGLHTDAGGSFQLRATDTTSGTLATSSAVDTDGGPGYGTASLLFTTGASTDHAVRCSWSATNVVGPFSSLLESVSLSSGVGFAVNNYAYNGGFSTEQLGEAMLGAAAQNGITQIIHLRMWLTELYERQVASGGSGRVVVWLNSGINGSSGDTEAEWVAGMTDSINAVRNAWLACGYEEESLAFIASVTHPTSAYNDPAVEPKLTTTRAAVQGWPDDLLMAANVTVLDISRIYSGGQLAALGYFAGTGTGADQAHLTAAGYKAIARSALSALMEGSAVPSITEPFEIELRLVGGAGGSWNGGGSGGQVKGGTANPVFYWVVPDGATEYNVTVGAAGQAADGSDFGATTKALGGGMSFFEDIVAVGGGRGGPGNSGTSLAGDGAGGGGGSYPTTASYPKYGRSVLPGGFRGGDALHNGSAACPGAGGAGASENGQDTQSTTKAGRGGNGITDSWDGTSRKMGVGGPGGNGFSGGTAADATESGATGGIHATPATSPTAGNYGSAGGGAKATGAGTHAAAAGLAGVVQIKYPGSVSRLAVVSGNAPTTSTVAIPGYVLHTFATAGDSVVTFS